MHDERALTRPVGVVAGGFGPWRINQPARTSDHDVATNSGERWVDRS